MKRIILAFIVNILIALPFYAQKSNVPQSRFNSAAGELPAAAYASLRVNINRIEIKPGYELFRNIPEAIFGYKIASKSFYSLVPEAAFICGPMVSVSVRADVDLTRRSLFFAQIGVGAGLLFGAASVAACGYECYLFKGIYLQVEARTLFVNSSTDNRNSRVEGYNMIKYRPLVLSAGISF